MKSKLFPNKDKIKIKPKLNKTKSNLAPNLQAFKKKLLSGNGSIVYK